MRLLPIQTINAIQPRMETLNSDGEPEFATEMNRIQLDIAMGKTPDRDRLTLVADGIEASVNRWETMQARLKSTGDFQTREYAKLTEAHLERYGVTPDGLANMMRWQATCLLSLANHTPPPMPPKDLDLQRIMRQAEKEGGKPPSMTKMSGAEKITAEPFTGKEAIFETPMVQDEYIKLCEEHENLIAFGGSYANFDPTGKIAFLDQIEQIEDRWDIFFTRFKLTGQMDPEYEKQCNDFLASMNLDEADYRAMLKRAHDMMRKEANQERNTLSF